MDDERDELLAVALRDYEERSSGGIAPPLLEYRSDLGEAWDDFVEIVDTEAELKALLEPVPAPPLGGLFGPYELLRLLGRGATGLVYEARNTATNRTEAVKILRPGLEAEPESLRRFQREVQLAQEFEHENIVHVYSCGEIAGYPYCAMELVDGMTLRQALAEGKLPPTPELCRELAGIADALAMLHENGILHRDVKPSNIVMRADGRMVLADFGLARAANHQRITWTGQMLGTPRYMSPEQLCGKEVDPRTDVYGLGATLYRVLADRPLFEADNVAALSMCILRDRPEPLDRVADVPPALSRIVMKAVENEPRDRHASAAELRDDLRAFAGGGVPRGRPVSPLRRLARKARRHWLPLSVAALVLIGAVIAGVATESLSRDARWRIEVLPAATVTLNGERLEGRATQFDLKAASGPWHVRLERDGFVAVPLDRKFAAGEEDRIERVLVVADANNRVAAELLKDALEAHAVLSYDAQHRGVGENVVPVFPQRKVRREDLGRYRIEINRFEVEADATGTITFTNSAGKELAALPFQADADVIEGAMPPEVVSGLRVGDKVTWRVVLAGEREEDAPRRSFTLAELSEEAAGRWKIVAERAQGQPAGIRAWLRGSFLFGQGFYQAALEAMRRLGPQQESLPPWVVAREATGHLQLEGTSVEEEIRNRIEGFPRAVREPWERGPR